MGHEQGVVAADLAGHLDISQLSVEAIRGLKAARLDEYLGLWCIHEEIFQAAWQHVQQMDLHVHVREVTKGKRGVAKTAAGGSGTSGAKPQYAVTSGGVAVIELSGSLMKMQSSLSSSSSTVLARRQLRLAAADDQVVAIAVKIDSPGGTMAGTGDLADDIGAAGQRKPLYSYIEDMACSAAFWAGCRGQKVYANSTAIVGSIGTYMVVTDYSANAAAQGIKVHVVKAGAMKGTGVPGTEVTPQQLADLQAMVDAANDQFVRAVAKGRRLTDDRARALADGRVYVGAAAQAAGLIDGVQSFDATLDQLAAAASTSKTIYPKAKGSHPMADATTTTEVNASETKAGETRATIVAGTLLETSATYHDLLTACDGADEKFTCSQLAVKATVEQAQKAWMKEQSVRLKASQEELLKLQASPPSAKRPGIATPVTTGTSAGSEAAGDAVSDFDALVEAQLVKTKGNRRRAIVNVSKSHPDVHQAYVRAVNQAMGRPLGTFA